MTTTRIADDPWRDGITARLLEYGLARYVAGTRVRYRPHHTDPLLMVDVELPNGVTLTVDRSAIATDYMRGTHNYAD